MTSLKNVKIKTDYEGIFFLKIRFFTLHFLEGTSIYLRQTAHLPFFPQL